MRLGLLGPADGNIAGLGKAAEFLLNVQKVDRAIYLGPDQALEAAVVTWATRLVGQDPTDDGAWRRAADLAVDGTAAEIDKFVRAERARLRLRALESIPTGETRTIEMIGDRVAVLIYDKALLDEEDIFAANLILYGKSDLALIKKIGARWFITPGQIGKTGGGGAAVLDDTKDEIVATVYDAAWKPTQTETLTMSRSTKMRIQSGGA
jgi:hypothetical protein